VLAGKRSARVGGELFKEIAELLEYRVKDPRVRSVTITGVEMSGDLKLAKIFYSVFDDETTLKDVDRGLQSVKGFIKREIGRRMELRYVPDLIFMHDPSLKRGEEMERLFDGLITTDAEEEES
jgi:ribosome-binding factor A